MDTDFRNKNVASKMQSLYFYYSVKMFKNISYVHKLMVLQFNVSENVAMTVNSAMLWEIKIPKYFDELAKLKKLATALTSTTKMAYMRPDNLGSFYKAQRESKFDELKCVMLVGVEPDCLLEENQFVFSIIAHFPLKTVGIYSCQSICTGEFNWFKVFHPIHQDRSIIKNPAEDLTYREYLFELEKMIDEIIKE